MRKDTTFSDRKLSREEFSKKYWLDGDAPYQYHSGTIEDGRDEREQFIFNNMVALHNEIKFYNQNRKAIKKITALAVTSTVISVIAIALVVASYFLK